jgi:hypothetical protein
MTGGGGQTFFDGIKGGRGGVAEVEEGCLGLVSKEEKKTE